MTFPGCSMAEYYPPSLNLYDPAQLHDLVKSTHQNVVPYTSTAADCWDALIALDATDSTRQYVKQIYSKSVADATDHGQSDSWNREHVWPKSRGVGYDGPDFTDLHALRPSDWNINSARSNRHFAPCGIAEAVADCSRPAHDEAAPDTERDAYVFLPPADRRGDVARAAFYMALRYDGSEAETVDLRLTDCPPHDTVAAGEAGDGEMGYLSHLLRWHVEDPVDDYERARNDAVCSDWQGNRNPFVDHPALVHYVFGLPRPYPAVDGGGYDCSIPNPSLPTGGGGTCAGLAPGDIMPVAVRSDNPDVVVLVTMVDVSDTAEIYITDNAWTGTEFKSNEGVKKFVFPAGGLSSGTVIGYGNDTLPYSSLWASSSGTLALSAASDAVHVYCLDIDPATSEAVVPYHLSALTYSGGWVAPTTDPASLSTEQSVLPETLPSDAVVTLPHKDNYRYSGARSGTRSDLLDLISAPFEWVGGDDSYFDVVSGWADFTIVPTPTQSPASVPVPAGACNDLASGDVMIAGYNAYDPDEVALVALSDLPPGVDIYITDAAWNGERYQDSEGLKKYTVPAEGIGKGKVFGYGDSFAQTWEGISGMLALSVTSDAVFAYCIDASSSIVHLSGLFYSTGGWSMPSTNGDFSTSESALPSELCLTCSVALAHFDNAVYVGSKVGTKNEILAGMSNPANWSGHDTERYELKLMLGEFTVT